MGSEITRAAIAAMLVAAPTTSVWAADDRGTMPAPVVRSEDERAPRKLIAQKMAMLEQAVTGSRLAARVRAAPTSEAATVFALAERRLLEARDIWARGEFDAADKALNEATWSLFRALQLDPVPDLETQQARHDELAKSVASLRSGYLDTAARLKTKAAGLGDVDWHIEVAASQAARQAYAEASTELERAQLLLLSMHESLLGNALVVYDNRFDSETDEYRFELSRNRDYQRLVPMASDRYRPDAGARAEIDRLSRSAGDLSLQAEVIAAEGRHGEAVGMLRDSTTRLQQALAVAGLVVPDTLPAR